MAKRRTPPSLEELQPRLLLSSVAFAGTAPGKSPISVIEARLLESPTNHPSSVSATRASPHVDLVSPSAVRGHRSVASLPAVAAPLGATPTVSLLTPGSGALLSGTAPTFSGIAGTVAGDSVVTLSIYAGNSTAGSPVQTLTVAADALTGAFSVSGAPLPQGPYTVQASQSDAAGDVASSTAVSYITFNTLPGDVNGDGQVDFSDFALFSNNYGATVTGGPAAGDFNFDGKVDQADFTILCNYMGLAVPAAPSQLALNAVSASSIQVSWADNSSNESGFHVYRSLDGASYTLAGAVPANATTFTDSGLAAGTTYFYRVAAYTTAGESTSVVSSAATLAANPDPVNIYTKFMTSFTELNIDGASGNDSILVTQSGGILSITADGQVYTYANTFGDLVIRGFAGNDSITVSSSVNIATLIYGGDGNNTLVNQTTGKATIVSIGDGFNVLTGNGVNTSYWCNPGDTVNASATEIANGAVNRVAGFYQPFTSSSVPLELYGQNLADPTDSGAEHQLTSNSFWGTGPVMADVNQGNLSDCYYLAPLASLANNETLKFMNTGVDLGDGTYAIRFERSGVISYVRVDGDLSDNGYAHPGSTGNLWALIYEKAYAFYRGSANTYASLNIGYQGTSFSDLGFSYLSIAASNTATVLLATIDNALNSGHALAAGTMTTIVNGAPLIASHCYSVIGAYLDSTGTLMIELRNPWGFVGVGDGPPNDGLVTISYTDFADNSYSIAYTSS